MDSLNFQLTITVLVLITFWHFMRRKSRVLDNISGPPSPSWFKGNYEQVFNPDAWGFHELLAKEYGSMTRLHGPYGTNTLYTFDPKAMQTVLVKDQDVFEEDDGFIKGNLLIFGEGLLGTLEQIYKIKLRAFEAGDEAVASQIGRGTDLISILMKENMDASEEDRLGDTEVIAQMNTLIFAAMDTTSSAMARLLHLLSRHPEAQKKLRQELIEAKRVKDGQDFSYEELTALPYLDAVCRETLRLYTPASAVTRRARQDAIIPLLKPIIGLDGTEIHEVAVPNDTAVIVSLSNSNRNSDLWGEDADEWKPERWLSPLPKALVDARIPGVYSHLMTFLGGGRSCMYVLQPTLVELNKSNAIITDSGFKFSQLEMKVVISTLVEKFQFSPSSKDSEIFWQMNGVTAPVIGKDNHPQLPMNISLVN
ncbi:hypothetical protein HHX47_DHR6000059 [Lentinula edodes]|nr:hypothetical protein HHX47_DHR6000059 [Lentinula edodes]